MVGQRERLFYETLKNLFVGAKVEGKSGYINLIRIKSKYYSKIEELIKRDIEEILQKWPDFREELFDKLYSFFKNYFSESGSVHFSSSGVHNQVYERVYGDGEDVSLFWKTRGLYYVKTDRLFRSMRVEIEGKKFYFDASQIEHRKSNERKSLYYQFDKVEGGELRLKVQYGEGGVRTDLEEICRQAKASGVSLKEEELEKAIRTFERQGEADFFLHRRAREFLKEQFDLWLYRYLTDTGVEWTQERIEQVQWLKRVAYKLIDFVGQFEEELVRIWEKPKFVRRSNYVVSLDRIASKKGGKEVIKKLIQHAGWKEQVREWIELGILEREPEALMEGDVIKGKYRFLPIDTKYFKDVELEVLKLFHPLDRELDGWLIKSENWQALNTILPKFRGKVQTIYIDPPFNLEGSNQFLYLTNYRDSTWATMLENRLILAKEFLKESGSIFLRCGQKGNWIARCLMDQIFGEENYRNEIIIKRGKRTESREGKRFESDTESLFFYAKDKDRMFPFRVPLRRKREEEMEWTSMFFPEERGDPLRVIFGIGIRAPVGTHWQFSQERIEQEAKKGNIRIICKRCSYIHQDPEVTIESCPQCGSVDFRAEYRRREVPLTNNWTDIPGYVYTVSKSTGFQTENSETLLRRVIESTSEEGDLVMDFFLGSGTTCAVAHKLRRKWIGVEMGEHFYGVVLRRMKRVLAYDKSGISEEEGVKEKYNKNSAGGFFKYYELEQYEDTLSKVKYEDEEPFEGFEDTYGAYLFMKDEKLAWVLELGEQEVCVNFFNLYDDVDLAETLSNLTGKFLESIHEWGVVFEGGERIAWNDVDYRLVKPLLWW
ncbi:MAG: site-specific DNA-methyltransferase [Aquificaceae bacterium]|nr:site-specific DNA-methyltransferase [Aquificaceae bacterium]